MIHNRLEIGRWDVDFLFAEEDYEAENVLELIQNYGGDDYTRIKAEKLMDECDYDCGFTFVNFRDLLAIVLIGPTSSGAEFLDTFVHEIQHLSVAITENLGHDLKGETPAYLAGDTTRELAEVICKLGCRHCRR